MAKYEEKIWIHTGQIFSINNVVIKINIKKEFINFNRIVVLKDTIIFFSLALQPQWA
jgi:hypothetical protein